MPNERLDAAELFRRAALSQDPKLQAQIKARAAEVVSQLDESDIVFTNAELQTFEADPTGLAEACAILGAADEQEPGDIATQLHLEKLHIREERQIARGVNALRRGLPRPLQNVSQWFEGVPSVPIQVAEELRGHWRARGANAHILGLTAKGISPATIFEATHGLYLLLHRQVRLHKVSALHVPLHEQAAKCQPCDTKTPPPSAQVEPAEQSSITRRLPLALVLAELRASPDCPPGAGMSLLRHIGLLAQYYPTVVAGFKVADASDIEIMFEVDPASQHLDILTRWQRGGGTP